MTRPSDPYPRSRPAPNGSAARSTRCTPVAPACAGRESLPCLVGSLWLPSVAILAVQVSPSGSSQLRVEGRPSTTTGATTTTGPTTTASTSTTSTASTSTTPTTVRQGSREIVYQPFNACGRHRPRSPRDGERDRHVRLRRKRTHVPVLRQQRRRDLRPLLHRSSRPRRSTRLSTRSGERRHRRVQATSVRRRQSATRESALGDAAVRRAGVPLRLRRMGRPRAVRLSAQHRVGDSG